MAKLLISGTSDYQKAVEGVVATIRGNEVGRVIVDGIEATNKALVIVPFNKGKAAVHGDNALARPDDVKAGAPRGVSRTGPPYFYQGQMDNPSTRADERYDMQPMRVVGTGKGSDVHLYFSPEGHANTRSSCSTGQYGCQLDEVLLHEMVHGLRLMQGLSNRIPTEDTLRKYNHEEEFLAIVVTNVYMSAKGSLQFRADHRSWSPLQGPLDTSVGFLANADNRKLMNIHKLIWEPTFAQLSRVLSAQFNPFRQLTGDLAYLYRK